jgi:flagellar biosynthetic protein FlhB
VADVPLGEKTEKPSPKRRRDAALKGQVPRSRELAGTLGLIVVLWASVAMLQGAWGAQLRGLVVAPLESASTWSTSEVLPAAAETARRGVRLAATPLLISLVAVTVGLLVQAPPVFTLEPLGLHAERFDPATNLVRLLAPQRVLAQLAWGHVKLAALVAAAAWGLWSARGALLLAGEAPIEDLAAHVAALVAPAARATLATAAVLALGDFAVQKVKHELNLRMTRQELKEELKHAEGDPLVKGRIRAIQREHARRKMMADVRHATVVVTNPTHYAVALRYRAGADPLPRVVARGKGYVALSIREEAARWRVPQVRSPALARTLYAEVPLGGFVLEAHYAAVAAILVEVLRDRSGGPS